MCRKILQLKSSIPFHAEYVNILVNTFSFVEAECSKRNSEKSEEFFYLFVCLPFDKANTLYLKDLKSLTMY